MADDPLAAFRAATAQLTGAGGPFAMLDGDDPHRRRFAGTCPDLPAFMDRTRRLFGDRVFLSFDEDHRTFEDVFAAAGRLAAGLVRDHGVQPGDRVGLAMRNRIEWFIAFFAVMRIGAIATLMNSRSVGEELALSAQQVSCRVILADEERAALLRGLAPCPVVELAEQAELIAGSDEAALVERTDISPDDPVMIIFTSGTTGRPKGATLTHRNLCAIAREMELRAEIGLRHAASQAGQDVEVLRAAMPGPAPALLITPLFHISGIVGMISALLSGGRIILMRRWDPVEALDLIDANGVGNLSGPSLVFADLLALPDAARRMRTLKNSAIAGQATPQRLGAQLRDSMPGMAVTSCWGQTELTGAATTANGPIFAAHPGSVGIALETLAIRIVDEAGNVLGPNEVGELQARGSTVMHGYWDDAEATAKAFAEGGWLRSGDLGYIDEQGLIYIADRVKDMVISGGMNIYCAEVERVLSMLEQQHEVALFGVPDERIGERGIAAVVLRPDAAGSLDETAVREHVRAHLAAYKVPMEVRFDLGPLPRNGLGKIDKAALRQLYLERSPAATAN